MQTTKLIIDKKFVTEDLLYLTLNRGNITFEAGQYFSIGLSELNINREYSVWSQPSDPLLEFYIKVVDGGTLSPVLAKRRLNTELTLNGPFGAFGSKIFDKDKEYLFIASGTGITPFHSIVGHCPNLRYKIYHGFRYENEHPKLGVISSKNYFPFISKHSNNTSSSRVTDAIYDLLYQENLQIYICGNSSMIIDAQNILFDKGFSGDQIQTEVFF